MKLKTRIKVQYFLEGRQAEAFYIVEVYHNRRWRLGGDDVGPFKFRTREEAVEVCEKYNGREVEGRLESA